MSCNTSAIFNFLGLQALSRKCWELATEVTKTNERVNSQTQVTAKGKTPRLDRAEKVQFLLS